MNASAPRKRHLIWRIVLSILKIGFLLVVLLTVAGLSYEFIRHREDQRRFPRQGQLVDVDGHALNMVCSGQGGPAVILESGLGDGGLDWRLVQPEIAKFTRVCSYDRAGYGWSASGPLPRTSLRITQELHTLLHNIGVIPPYVLVGHSRGGYVPRIYNHEYPDEVVAVVLVDSSHEDQGASLPPAKLQEGRRKQLKQFKRLAALSPILIRFGIARLWLRRQMAGTMPPDMVEEMLYQELQPTYARTIVNELEALEESNRQVRQSGDFGSKPLIVLTAGKNSKDTWIHGLQVQLVHLSTQGKQIIVPESGHMIPLEAPQTIVSAVREVWQAVTIRQEAVGGSGRDQTR